MVVVRKRKSKKMNLFQKQTLVWGGIGAIAFTFIANSVKADTQVQDHYKNIIYKKPSNIEVCYERQVSGDKTGDVGNVDYKCSIDPENNELRPKHKMQNIGLSEQATTDTQRTSSHYQKTGDIVTLPYTEEVLTEQLVATRVERITPLLLSSWQGTIELDPFGDDWFDASVIAMLVMMGMFMDTAKECIVNGADESSAG